MNAQIILSSDIIRDKAHMILDDLHVSVDESVPDEIANLLERLSVHMADTSLLIASATYLYEQAVSSAYDSKTDSGVSPLTLSPMTAKHYVQSKCYNQKSLLVFCDRLHSSLVHRCDALRSLLSYKKAEIKSL